MIKSRLFFSQSQIQQLKQNNCATCCSLHTTTLAHTAHSCQPCGSAGYKHKLPAHFCLQGISFAKDNLFTPHHLPTLSLPSPPPANSSRCESSPGFQDGRRFQHTSSLSRNQQDYCIEVVLKVAVLTNARWSQSQKKPTLLHNAL